MSIFNKGEAKVLIGTDCSARTRKGNDAPVAKNCLDNRGTGAEEDGDAPFKDDSQRISYDRETKLNVSRMRKREGCSADHELLTKKMERAR